MIPKTGLEAFSQGQGVAKLRQFLAASARRPILWNISGQKPVALDYAQACRTCRFVRSASGRKTCQRRFLGALQTASKTAAPVQFLCPIERYAAVFPLRINDQVQGYLGVCHREEALPRSNLDLAGLAVASAAAEFERSQELKNLSEAVQPRCVALSTIHTIHRLISSTLNLQELLPRVARLCCQVLRAESCVIWLLDRDKKRLIPKAVIDAGKGKPQRSLPPCRLGTGIPGRVAAECKGRMAPFKMHVPLVEEDCLGVIEVVRGRRSKPFSTLDQEILTTLAEQAVVAIRNAQMYETQERVTWGTIRALSAILDGMEADSPRGPSHRQFLAEVAVAIAQKFGVSPSLLRPIEYAALLHDAGRVGIPKEILQKPTQLEPEELAVMQQHPVKGARLLEPLETLEPAIPIILYHHERYDGTGYPKGLKKENIPLGARILAVANAFEAMVCERPYRKTLSIQEAAREIASHAGTQFDHKVVSAFLSLVREKKLEKLRAGFATSRG